MLTFYFYCAGIFVLFAVMAAIADFLDLFIW
jgi:hypothetical protein